MHNVELYFVQTQYICTLICPGTDTDDGYSRLKEFMQCETEDGYSRLQDLKSADKHTSIHIYNTIATLRRELINLPAVPLPTERSQSEMRDYEVPVSALSNHMTTLSLESIQPSNRTTMTFIPSDYEVPSTAMSGYCSDGGVAESDCSSTSYVSIPEEPFVIDSDMELWRRCKQRLDSDAAAKRNKIWVSFTFLISCSMHICCSYIQHYYVVWVAFKWP